MADDLDRFLAGATFEEAAQPDPSVSDIDRDADDFLKTLRGPAPAQSAGPTDSLDDHLLSRTGAPALNPGVPLDPVPALRPGLEEAPTPRTPDQLREAMAAHARSMPPAAHHPERERLAQASAIGYLRRHSLTLDDVTPEEFDALQGAFSFTQEYLYGAAGPEEARGLVARSLRLVMEKIERDASIRVNQSTSGARPASPALIAQHDRARLAARWFVDHADSSEVQAAWQEGVRFGLREQSRRTLNSRDAAELGLTDRVLEAFQPTGQDPEGGTTPWPVGAPMSFPQLLSWAFDNTESVDEVEQVLAGAGTFALREHRREVLGVPQGASDDDLMAQTHPELIMKLAQRSGLRRATAAAVNAGPKASAAEKQVLFETSLAQSQQMALAEMFFSGAAREGDPRLLEIGPREDQPVLAGVAQNVFEAFGYVGEGMRLVRDKVFQPASHAAFKGMASFGHDLYTRTRQRMDTAFGAADDAFSRAAAIDFRNSTLRDILARSKEAGSVSFEEAMAIMGPDRGLGHAGAIGLWPDLALESLEQGAKFGLAPEAIRDQFLAMVAERSRLVKLGFKPEDVAASVQTLQKAQADYLGGKLSFGDYMATAVLQAPVFVGGAVRAQVDGLVSDAEGLATDITLDIVSGGAYGTTVSPAINASVNSAAKLMRARRLSRSIARAAAVDPAALDRLRKFADNILAQGGEHGALVAKEIGHAADHITTKFDAAQAGGFVDVRPEAREVATILRGIGDASLTQLSKHMEVDSVTQRLASSLNPLQLAKELTTSIMEKFGRFNLQPPEWLAKYSQRFATELTDAINAGQPAPQVRGISIAQTTKARASARGRITQWITENFEHLRRLQVLNSELRARQVDFMDFVKARAAGQMHDLEGAARFMQRPEAEVQEIVQPVFELARNARAAADQLRARVWDNPAAITRTSVWEATPAEAVVYWAQSQADETAVWRALRNRFETRERFRKRVATTLAGAMDETRLGQPGKATAALARLKQRIGRSLLNSEGVGQDSFFTREGALTAGQARVLEREQAELAEAAQIEARISELSRDPGARREVAGLRNRLLAIEEAQREIPGFGEWTQRVEDLPEEWRLINQAAKTEKAALGQVVAIKEEMNTLLAQLRDLDPSSPRGRELAGRLRSLRASADKHGRLALSELAERSLDMHDDTLAHHIQVADNMAESHKFSVAALVQKNANLFGEYRAMSPAEQKLFDAFLMAQDDLGAAVPYGELRRLAPTRFAGLGSVEDQNVLRLLRNKDEFWRNLLDDMLASGQIDPAAREALGRSYTPRLYQTYVSGRLLDIPTPGRTELSTLRRPNLSEFEQRRHPELYTATVSIRNGGFVTERFTTPEGARAWIANQYGIKKVTKEGKKTTLGRTSLGDRWRISAPLGKAVTEALGPLAPGPGLFARLEQVVTDMSLRNFTQILARPFSESIMDAKQYARYLQRRGLRPEDVTDYVRTPVSTKLGALSDRFVHIDSLNAYRRFTDSFVLIRALTAGMKDFVNSVHALDVAARVGGKVLGAAAGTARDLITSLGITKNPATIAWTVLGDAFLYAPRAAPGLLTSLRGFRNVRKAADILLGTLRLGQGVRGEDRVLIETLMRAGVLDDTLADISIPTNLNRDLVETLFGPSPTAFGQYRGLDTLLQALGAQTDDPQLNKILSRLDAIDKTDPTALSTQQASALARERIALEKQVRDARPGAIAASVRAWKQLSNFLLGRATGRFAERPDAFRTLYGRLNNVLRLGAVLHNLEEGKSIQDAIGQVTRFMQTYSRLPKFLNTLSRSPWGSPVLSFAYEHARIAANLAREDFAGLLGMMAGLSAVNFTTMAGAGIDPYQMQAALQTDDPHRPWWTTMASRVVLPVDDGLAVLGSNNLDPWSPMRAPMGVISEIVSDHQEDQGLLRQLGGLAGNFALRTIGGSPVAATVLSLATGRSPRTGQPTSNLLSENLWSWARVAMPVWFPGGQWHQALVEGQDRPPRLGTGRKVALANLALEATTGLRLRGITFPGMEQFARLIAGVSGADLRRPLRFGDKELPFNQQDQLSLIYASSAQYDPGNDRVLETVQSDLYPQMRSALWYSEQPEPELKAFGEGWMKQLLERDKKARSLRAELELGDKRPEEQVRLLVSLLRAEGKAGYQFSEMSTTRKADVIRKIHAMLRAPALVKQHVYWAIFSDTGRERNLGSTLDIEAAQTLLQNYLQNNPRQAGTESILFYLSWLDRQRQRTQRADLRAQLTDPYVQEARKRMGLDE